MSDIKTEPTPGTAFRKIMEETSLLAEFMKLVKEKLELDERHLYELKSFRTTWDSQWSKSKDSPLMSPILDYFDTEISEKEKLCEDINTHFAAMPEGISPDRHSPDGFDPNAMPWCLSTVYTPCVEHQGRARTSDDVTKYQQNNKNYVFNGVLPYEDRQYRETVCAQWHVVGSATQWYTDVFTDVLEDHQQRAEDHKALVYNVLRGYSNLSSNLSISCSTSIKATSDFASTRFISPRYDQRDMELSHILIQKFDYQNYMIGGKVARPVFGLGPNKTISLISTILDSLDHDTHVDTSMGDLNTHWSLALLRFERDSLGTEISSVLEGYSPARKEALLQAALLSDVPLISIGQKDIQDYADGIARTKIEQLLKRTLLGSKQDILPLLFRVINCPLRYHPLTFEDVVKAFTGDIRSNAIMREIWRKWNIENHCPLPSGVERTWIEGEPCLVWKKNGLPYVFPESSRSNNGEKDQRQIVG